MIMSKDGIIYYEILERNLVKPNFIQKLLGKKSEYKYTNYAVCMHKKLVDDFILINKPGKYKVVNKFNKDANKIKNNPNELIMVKNINGDVIIARKCDIEKYCNTEGYELICLH